MYMLLFFWLGWLAQVTALASSTPHSPTSHPSQHRTERGPEPHTAHHLVVAVSALRLVEVRAVRTTPVPLEAPSPSRLLPLELLLRPPPTTLRRPPARETEVQAREQHVRLRLLLSHTAHEPLAQQPRCCGAGVSAPHISAREPVEEPVEQNSSRNSIAAITGL